MDQVGVIVVPPRIGAAFPEFQNCRDEHETKLAKARAEGSAARQRNLGDRRVYASAGCWDQTSTAKTVTRAML